jgi:sugar/nucleoside kinase (ribokinase family)
LAWTAGAAVCFPNKDEGIALTGLSAPDNIVDALVKVYGIVALKLGAEGVLVGTGAERVRLPAVSASALDSTGAGDAFCAGFLAAWLDGTKPGDAAAAGLHTAAVAVGLAGGRPPLR